jgi:hypothetical protein
MFFIVLFLLGFFLSSLGLSFSIIYFNLMTMGYSFSQYVHFIISRIECSLLWIGILLMLISWKGKEIYELLLRRFTKF